MYKIWAKTIRNERITKSHIYKHEGKFDIRDFESMLPKICEEMDVPTPVILVSHIRNFDNFGIARFLASDFVEDVPFDFFTLEYVKEQTGRIKHLYKEYLPVD
ncbi:MAG: hypothetical protein E7350_01455 [Clostridiales bacterium]|nr:hypothetical protein [Clostridiales bacterium]